MHLRQIGRLNSTKLGGTFGGYIRGKVGGDPSGKGGRKLGSNLGGHVTGKFSGHVSGHVSGNLKRHLARSLFLLAAGLAGASAAHAGDWCGGGIWVDAMLGSYHIRPDPDKHFEQFNPGLGVECWLNNQWALTAGGFRNSLRRPSYYGGGVWAPEFLHWGIVRIAAMGGIISGYNYGNWGLGRDHTIGPVLAPLVMVEYKRVGANIIVIPPIPSDDLPFTLGFQLKVKF